MVNGSLMPEVIPISFNRATDQVGALLFAIGVNLTVKPKPSLELKFQAQSRKRFWCVANAPYAHILRLALYLATNPFLA